MLEFVDIGKSFAGVRALDGVSFDVRAGEVHAIIGENGAGKSTLMKILSGAHTDYEGTVLMKGVPLTLHSPRDAQRHGIATIYQELNLIPELSVAENIFLGRERRGAGRMLDHGAMAKASRELLDRLALAVSTRRPVKTLRVGEQQLVEVAKALSLDARVLILDEPTSALSDAEVRHLFDVVATLKSEGVTLLYISHRFEEVFEIADRITVLRDGRHVATVDADATDQRELIGMMVGRPLSDLFPRADSEIGEPVLSVAELTLLGDKRTGARAVGPVSFEVRRGEIVGIAGLLGAGRTELLETVFGVPPRHRVRGTIHVAGRPVRITSPSDAIAAGLAFVTEDRKTQSLVTKLSVRQNITMAALRRFLRCNVLQRRREDAAVAQATSDLRIKSSGPEAIVDTLSGGNQQKVALAKCLLTEPTVLLLDEPTRGIDVGAKAEIYGLIGRLAAGGAGVVMASSELPELLAMCDRILVLSLGRLTGELTRETATQELIMEAATARLKPGIGDVA